MKNFSVLMSVYRNDKPDDLCTAIESISIKQTVQPDEIYIYVDGTVPEELADTIKQLQIEIPTINVHWERDNKGLGIALQYGMLHVKNELVARMDADDIAVPDRFECQIKQFEEDPTLSVASGHIVDFIGSVNNIVGKREVPIGNEATKNRFKLRDGLNHPAVMFRKSEVIRAGNYQDWHYNEDSYLWLRMYLAGCKFNNLDKVLVYMRSGSDMYARRGGWRYFYSEARLQWYMLRHGIIWFPRYLFNVSVRLVVQVIMPNSVRGFVFQRLFRK